MDITSSHLHFQPPSNFLISQLFSPALAKLFAKTSESKLFRVLSAPTPFSPRKCYHYNVSSIPSRRCSTNNNNNVTFHFELSWLIKAFLEENWKSWREQFAVCLVNFPKLPFILVSVKHSEYFYGLIVKGEKKFSHLLNEKTLSSRLRSGKQQRWMRR